MDLGIYNLHIIIKLFGKPESINYFPTMQKNIDTSGILHLSYSDKQASSIAAKDSFHLMSALLKVKKVHLLFMVILMKYLKSECN